jgi:hypothetical protein
MGHEADFCASSSIFELFGAYGRVGNRYTPTEQDVGCFLTVTATPLWDGEPCAPPVALRLPRRVQPAPARPHARARLRGLGDRDVAVGAAGGSLRVMTYNGRVSTHSTLEVTCCS